ncbi:hypothetical protein Bca52824_080461 [Brassica carinata]|uniref:Uncharacterized protein n=1 Tax=Brassica carinata TaxID=52824 RepID=A0A8X7PFG8_BRACI|nr:hypothetical protein Bca52824_080461 [Brassica carinata]
MRGNRRECNRFETGDNAKLKTIITLHEPLPMSSSATVSGDTPYLSVMSVGLSPFYFEARIRWFSFIFATVVIPLFWGVVS